MMPAAHPRPPRTGVALWLVAALAIALSIVSGQPALLFLLGAVLFLALNRKDDSGGQ